MWCVTAFHVHKSISKVDKSVIGRTIRNIGTCEEIIVAVSGSFDVEVFDGHERQSFHLNHPYQGLYIGTGVWRTLEDFSSGSVCLVLASELFDEDEYIYNYDEFLELTKNV